MHTRFTCKMVHPMIIHNSEKLRTVNFSSQEVRDPGHAMLTQQDITQSPKLKFYTFLSLLVYNVQTLKLQPWHTVTQEGSTLCARQWHAGFLFTLFCTSLNH